MSKIWSIEEIVVYNEPRALPSVRCSNGDVIGTQLKLFDDREYFEQVLKTKIENRLSELKSKCDPEQHRAIQESAMSCYQSILAHDEKYGMWNEIHLSHKDDNYELIVRGQTFE